VRMSVANLSSLAGPPGKTNAVWLTRFLALSTANGAEAYRIFGVGVESVAGGAPAFFVASTSCAETTPGNCKLVSYGKGTPVPGQRDGNSWVLDVPLSAFGQPVGPTLYSVTGLTFGRNADIDVYADVDAAQAFDFALG
jgi:hypothetical protein